MVIPGRPLTQLDVSASGPVVSDSNGSGPSIGDAIARGRFRQPRIRWQFGRVRRKGLDGHEPPLEKETFGRSSHYWRKHLDRCTPLVMEELLDE